jgi:hypothetical protein
LKCDATTTIERIGLIQVLGNTFKQRNERILLLLHHLTLT